MLAAKVVDHATASGTVPAREMGTGRANLSLRDRYNAFVARYEVAWELSMALLAVAYVALGFMPEEGRSFGLAISLLIGRAAPVSGPPANESFGPSGSSLGTCWTCPPDRSAASTVR